MGKGFIFEVYKGNSFNVDYNSINESQANVPEGMMRVTGVAAVIGVKNRNGRIYDKDNYIKHINLLQDDIEYGLYGELEHPEGFTINNNNISHKIEKVWFNPVTNEVMITILILDTPKGKIAQSIIKSGGTVRVSSRAQGSVSGVNATIDKLVTFDIVGTPGFKETNLHLSEGYTHLFSNSLCESYFMPMDDVKNINESILTSAIEKQRAGIQNNDMKKWLINCYTPMISEFINESLAPLIESYIDYRMDARNQYISFADYSKTR